MYVIGCHIIIWHEEINIFFAPWPCMFVGNVIYLSHLSQHQNKTKQNKEEEECPSASYVTVYYGHFHTDL